MPAPRILMIISLFYPALGGAEQQALRLAAQLIERGVHVTVLTRSQPGCSCFEHICGVPVHRAIRTVPWGKLFGISYFLSCLWYLVRRRTTYDLIHCHILQGLHSCAGLVMKRLFKKKIIVKIAMAGGISDFAVLKNMRGGGLLLGWLRAIDRVVTLCSQSRREAVQEGFSPERIVTIPNGVDTELFRPSPGVSKTADIIYVGALDQRKNVRLLIDAVKRLHDAGTRVTLNIVGCGPEQPKLEAQARDLGIAPHISFNGPSEAVAGHLLRARVFVLPSLYEGLPNVLLEAMACGLPAVATAVGGAPDVIQHGKNGMLVPPGDCDALCDRLRELLGSERLQQEIGAAARATAAGQFSLSAVADSYTELYAHVASE